jgi:PAS domain S-box-containing protein
MAVTVCGKARSKSRGQSVMPESASESSSDPTDVVSEALSLQVGDLLKVLDLVNLGIYITDRDRRILLWNRAAEEITGHLARDVVGRQCHAGILDHCDKDGRSLCDSRLCPLYRTMKLGKGNAEPILVQAKKANGRRVVVSTTCAPLFDDSGNVVGGIETFRDETARVLDLEFARRVQRHLMTPCLPDVPGVRLDVRYYPHDMIGGDFYDVSCLGDDKFGIIVADVMGHGVSAALYTVCLKDLTERFAKDAQSPAEFLGALNRELVHLVVDSCFATAFFGVLDARNGDLMYSSAGHPGPLHFSAQKSEVTDLDTLGMPLGVDTDSRYECSRISIRPGDALLAYTDGLSETSTAGGKMLGAEGLAEIFKREATSGREEFAERVYRQVLDVCREVSLTDDALLLTISREA